EKIDRVLVHVALDREPVGETQPLNIQIRLQRNELLAERALVGLTGDRLTEDGRELSEDACRGRRRFEGGLRHGAQRVEQKMRLQLRLEKIELGAREQRLQLRCQPLPVA